MKAAEDFGPWLARQLKNARKSQTDLAEELGMTRAAVSAWIVGRSVPRDETIRRIAEVLRTDLETIHTRSTDAQVGLPVSWYHRPAHADGGREYGNAAAFAFEADVSVLAREATQNSLDARLDPAEPVRIRYTLHELTGEALARFREAIEWERLLPHYEALTADGGRQGKVSRTIAAGLRDMYQHDRLVLLRVDDYNATGLTGGDYDNGLFAAVVRRQLDSHKKDSGAGGSYGLGKATLWATSRLGLVLINSTLSEPHEGRTERRLIGRLDLPWREVDGLEFAGPAWFGRPDPDTRTADVARSWWADEETVERLHLTRESAAPGTSFLIVGAHDVASLAPVNGTADDEGSTEDDDSVHRMHARLVDALGRNFWAAMTGGGDHKPHLEASVRTYRNGEVLIPEEHVDPAVTQPSRTRALRAFLEGDTVDRLTAPGQVARAAVPLNVPLRGGQVRGGVPHEAVLLVTHAEDADGRPNRLVSMRGNRMTVKDSAVTNVPIGTNPFQAILLTGRAAGQDAPGAEAAEEFLRASEPPEHNKWGQTEELRLSYSPSAHRRIAALTTAANNAVRDLVAVPRAKRRSGGEVRIAGRLKMGGGIRKKARAAGAAVLPELDNVDALVDETGAWSVTVDLRVSPGVDTDRPVTPVAKFDVRSGPRPPAPWKDLVAISGCEVVDGALHLSAGSRKAVFRGVTDLSRHPVRAQLTGLVVELRAG
ncbi:MULTISPECIES: helix-turn-helix domain-containing protein [Streptomyces]|uniref:Helix-turn-helix domain-containing protein n=1 Tax=Streptomyces sudanensis TaxID=436397 RepID=A0ABY4TIX4_9ACTN|nr:MULTISPECIES: helix-turn-helix transcriptional regulator [Streptomyces]URN17708.1 helix-turn-helix domain-containing protein [Streptomyces sudanensis]